MVTIFALSLLISAPSMSHAYALKSNILSTIDGLSFGIDGDTVAMIKQYQSQMRGILMGKLNTNGRRFGTYPYEGKQYSAHQLADLEEQLGSNPRFRKLLKQMRSDFEQISEPFKKIVLNVKSIMAILIEESCHTRKRMDSLLLTWAKTDQHDEYALFDAHVKNSRNFAIFITDLYNFLGDLTESCPKARAQFNERVEKYKQVKALMPQTNIKASEHTKALSKINPQLGKLKIEEISIAKIEELAKQS